MIVCRPLWTYGAVRASHESQHVSDLKQCERNVEGSWSCMFITWTHHTMLSENLTDDDASGAHA